MGRGVRVLFVHYRTGERDGVSFELERRARIIQELGNQCFYLTGFDTSVQPNVFVVKELDLRSNFNKFLHKECFYKHICNENLMIAPYYQRELRIYKKIQKVLQKLQPELIFVHNLFSHAYNLPATTALLKALDRYQIPTVTVNHDLWFERQEFQKPNYHFIREILEALPPKRHFILKHQVINSFAANELKKRRGIPAEKIGDYFDYTQPIPGVDAYNKDLPKYFGITNSDFIILHATRITNRKAIENAIIFAHTLEKKLRSYAPIKLNGRIFHNKSRVVLLFPNFVEVGALVYFNKVKCLAEKKGVAAIWAADKFLPQRCHKNGVKLYSFWDSYVFADLVTYTSIWEGFGNQLLEAIYFKKLPLVFEYPVFVSDIKQEGYQIVSLGRQISKRNGLQFVPEKVISNAAEKVILRLNNPKKLNLLVEKNFRIAQKHHDESLLKRELAKLLKGGMLV